MTKYTYNYNCLIDYCNSNSIKLDRNYKDIKVTRDTFIEGFCSYNNCILKFNKSFRQLKKTGAYCISCSKIQIKNKVKKTCLEKYGVEHALQVKSFRDAANKTIKEKYGVNNISQSQEIKTKKSQTCLKNFGVHNSLKSQIVKDKIKLNFINKYNCDNPFKSEIIKNQIKETNIKKYGFENPQQSDKIKEKTKNTCLQKYDVTSVLLVPETIKKRKESCLNKYGNEVPLKTELGKETVRQTCIKKYGTEYPNQVPEIAEKSSKNSYRKKEYSFPSGNKIFCQGYEPFALDKLIKDDNINETDIVTGCKNVPTIWYNDDEGKKHRHYVDIFIPSQNRCIEVKSTWTAKKNKDNIFLKQISGKELGYEYEIWIYNNKKELVEKHL
jgi:hypothetical protein